MPKIEEIRKEFAMNGDNPCNICEHRTKCLTLDCVFSTLTHTGSSQCCNYDCMNNTEFGCIFSFEEKCAASTCYVDDEDDMEDEDDEAG